MSITTTTVDPRTVATAGPADAPSTTTRRSAGDRLASLPVWRVGALAGVVSAVAVTLTVVVAEALGVPMEAAPRTADAGEHLAAYMFPLSMVMSTALGTLIAAVLYRTARRPGRTFTIVALALTAISFSGPITTGHATTATRLVLELTHVVGAAIVIPALAYRLDRRPGAATTDGTTTDATR